MVFDVRKSTCWMAFMFAAAVLFCPARAGAQTDEGFVYALLQVNAGANQVHGFSVNSLTGALTAVPGSPFATGGSGTTAAVSEGMVYDSVNGRLFVVNDGSDTVTAFAVNRGTGALAPLPFSPIAMPGTGTWGAIAISPDGSILVVGDGANNRLATFLLAGSSASAAPGSPFATGAAASPFSIQFSSDGAFVYAGGNFDTGIAGFAVNAGNGALTALAGSPFPSGAGFPAAYATDTLGRLFTANISGGQLRAFTSSAGVLTPVAGNPFASGLADGAVRGLLHRAGAYMVADRAGHRVGVYQVTGAGSATTLTAVAGSPFGTGGTFTNTLALSGTGSLLFAGNGLTRNITTFRVNSNLALTSISLQAANSVGSAGLITGLAFVPFSSPFPILEFVVPTGGSEPRGIAAGPDGNIWFTELFGNKIGRITMAGTITEFTIPTAGSNPEGITAGPDGNLWFAEFGGNKIGRITPAGVITEFPLPNPASAPGNLAVGSDGNLWFTEFNGNRIGRITTAGVITEFPVPSGGNPFGITSGPDGNLWFTAFNGNRIGRITTSGVVTEFPIPSAGSFPFDITTGPDGALWFSENGASRIGRITTLGSASEFSGTSSASTGITQGPDGNIWYTNARVGRMTPGGSITEYISPNPASGGHITTGPDGNMWFTETTSNRIGVLILPKVSLTVQKSGTGTGTVTGTVGSIQRINCGANCGALIPEEAVITLTATPAVGSRFVGWSGAGCTGTLSCVRTLTKNTILTATFNPIPTMTLTPSTLNFAATNAADALQFVTPAQALRLTQSGGPPAAWTATVNQPWLTVSPTSGNGPATIAVSINNTDAVLPTSGNLSGTITITTVGATGPTTATVNLAMLPPAGVISPFGSFDTPAHGIGGVTGSIPVTGWALDDLGVGRVRIMRDPVAGETPGVQVFLANAVFIAGARPDVAAAFPTRPFFERAGWGVLVLTNFLPNQGNGTFTLYAYADDVEGHSALLGVKTITCTNATATLPFGAIDTPTQGGIASGSAFVNFGWALTPQPKSIPTDGSTISVFIDSVSTGTLTSYNHARADIQALFPGYANTNGAVGFKTIDTTALANGIHTIAWLATDNAGAFEGIGSRFFTVSNSSVSGSVTAAMSSARTGFDQATAINAEAAVVDEDTRLLKTLEPSGSGIAVRHGFSEQGPEQTVLPGADGVHHVRTKPDDRIVLELGGADRTGATYRGYSIVDGEWRGLPVGSTLDAETGEFAWAPPLGFGGTHALVFVREVDGAAEPIRVDVTIELPAARGLPQMYIDRPGPETTVGQRFTIVGWAFDPNGPSSGVGIDSLHVWAHPVDGSAPVWIGVAKPGGVRPDVAWVHGARYLRSGFAIEAGGLAPGTYDIAVYAHSIAGNRFSVAQAVRVTVR
jgi:streptogramin lyase